MSTSELNTTALRALVDRIQQGEASALNELLSRAAQRLERLARSMLKRYPQVRQYEQTGDVVQEASLSLLRALRELPITSTRDFYALAGEHMRRRLLDLARRHRRGGGMAVMAETPEPPPSDDRSDELDTWAAMHEAVEALPADQREVFALRFYHGWEQQEIADLLQVSTKTVQRLWLRGQVTLGEALGGRKLPG